MNSVDKKIQKLLTITDELPSVEYYPPTHCDMYKISNPYTKFAKDTLVLCPLDEGFEQALDMAYNQILKKKNEFFLKPQTNSQP